VNISFHTVKTKFRIDGFNCHHLIPRQVVEARSFARFFGNLRSEGFDADDFISNGMHLPSTEKLALIFKLPMHRGPHPHYNELVATHGSDIARLKPSVAMGQIADLQKRLRGSLRTFGSYEIALARNPMAAVMADELDHIGHLVAVRNSIPRLP
jgi:A nuclease family of the HNH/ENDO VII superfamily with conserved AHH